MSTNGALPFYDPRFGLTLGMLLLASLAPAGLALLNTGLGRSRSAAQSLLGCLAMIAAACMAFTLIGATIADSATGAGHVLSISGKPWNWAGTGPLVLSGFANTPARAQLGVLFEFLALALAVLIPWGSGADRLRLTGRSRPR